MDRQGRCGICGGETRVVHRFGPRSIARCLACGTGRTIYDDARMSQAGFESAGWSHRRELRRSLLLDEARERYRALDGLVPKRRILEVGCGTGEFLHVAAADGHDVAGVEPSAEACGAARKLTPHARVFCGTVEDGTLSPDSFDVVAAFHVLEHVESPQGFLSRLRGVLSPGGILYVRVPNIDCWYRKAFGSRWWGWGEAFHVWHFSRDGLERLIVDAGFRPDEAASRYGRRVEKYPLWPLAPLLLYRRGQAKCDVERLLSDSRRRRSSSWLIRAQSLSLALRRASSLLLWPLLLWQVKADGNPELALVARKPDAAL